MKKRQVKFICDNCNKETKFFEDTNKKDFEEGHPYKYQEGWIYIFEMKMKIWKRNIEFKDLHFCNQDCMLKFLKKEVEENIKKQVIKKLK